MLASLAFMVRAERRARRLTFLLRSRLYRCGRGPWALPPRTHWGAVIEPWRARPVPFCFQGFLPPPETSELFLTATVPLRRLTCWNLATSYRRFGFGSAPNTSSESSISETFFRLRSTTSNL